MSDKRLIIGVGSGRCGTHSLAALLNSQQSSDVTHEIPPYLPWDHSGEVLFRCQNILSRDAHLCGDVAFFYLVYLPRILDFFPEAFVIGLKRDKAGTLASFKRWHERQGLKRWAEDGTKDVWKACFPTYEAPNRCELYWEEYYDRLEKLREQYPKRIAVFDMEALNSPGEILDALGIEKEKQVLKVFRQASTIDT